MNLLHTISQALQSRDEDQLIQLLDNMNMMLIPEDDRQAWSGVIESALEMMGDLEVAG